MSYAEQDTSMNYALLLGGVASVLFGLLLFTQTAATLSLLMLLIGLLWFIQGIAAIMGIFLDKTVWGWKLFSGVIGIAAGWLVFKYPLESSLVLPAVVAFLFGIFGVIIGIGGLIDAFKGGGWGVGIVGAIAILIGLLFIFNSVISGQILVWLLALLLVIQGGVAIFYAYKYR